MSRLIRLLSEQTINQIAAGEVIENPSSVVKELVENALDAGATDIHVLLCAGGRSLIQITDNGCGMQPEDAEACFQRYATSKLRDVEDLFALHTMGFRGEALSSIASIAKCKLITATEHNNGMGTCIEIEGGQMRPAQAVARSKGTTVEVRDLFYNVPVRRKFQKSPHIDVIAVHRIMIQLALAHPEVRFCLISDQKTLLLAPALSHLKTLEALKERIQAVLGDECGTQMRPIEAESPICSVRGFLSAPLDAKPGKMGQYFLLNARAVGSTPLAMAVREGYGTALPQGRYPRFVLQLTLPPDSIDVNVHPQKKEVRLRNELRIRQWLSEVVSKALYTNILTETTQKNASLISSDSLPFPFEYATPVYPSKESPSFLCAEEHVAWQPREDLFIPREPFEFPQTEPEEQQLPLPLPPPKLPPRVLSTLPGYLLLDPQSPHFADKPMGLWLLDQRAAHRRVLHDQLAGMQEPRSHDSQLLMRPVIVTLSSLQEQLFSTSQEFFTRSGWQIEAFGPSSVAIRAIPHAYRDVSYEALFLSLLDPAEEKEFTSLQAASSRFACVLARRCLSMQTQLSPEEASSLVKGLFACQQFMCCPLGKATLLWLPLDQFSTLFKGAP